MSLTRTHKFRKRVPQPTIEIHVNLEVVVVVVELQQEQRPPRSKSTVDDAMWQLWAFTVYINVQIGFETV